VETRDAIITALKCVVAITLIIFAGWLILLWLCLWPFRLALHRSQNRQQLSGRATAEELAVLVSLAMSGVALLRSGQPSMTMREWKRRRRKLMAQRPDDTIPF
jgi:hypothetical protein